MTLVPLAADVVGEVFQARLRLGIQLETCPSLSTLQPQISHTLWG